MNLILGICIFLVVANLIQHSCYFFAIAKSKKSPPHLKDNELPSVSICMAARDEEDCIEIALKSLLALDYPTSKLQIWIADDQSSDKTPAIIKKYAEKFEHLNYYLVTGKYKRIRGKQNALAHVIKESDTGLIAIVDADTEVKPKWLKELTSYFDERTAMVCGVTSAKCQNSFNSIAQHFDWIYAAIMFKAHSEMGIPISGLGNNMIYRRSAYEELGGYESIKYSVNEDHRIFSEMCEKRGHGYKQVLSYNGTNLTMPIGSFMGVVQQRYRWMKGGKDVVLHSKIAVMLICPAKTAAVLAIFINWQIGLTLLGSLLLADAAIRLLCSIKVGVPSRLYFLPFWYLNSIISGALIPVCFLFSKKITWRGRKV